MRRQSQMLVVLFGSLLLCACGGVNGGGGGQHAATHFSVSVPPSATAGSSFNITVTALDASNNTVNSYAGTVHFASTDPQAALPKDSTLSNGTGTFAVTLKTAGGQALAAEDVTNSSITGHSSLITVNASAAASLRVSAPSDAVANASLSFTVTALDPSGNTANNYTGTVHFSSSDSKAVLPPDSQLTSGIGNFSLTFQTVGTQTLTATDSTNSSITGASGPIQVAPSTSGLGFTPTGSMQQTRESHTSSLLNDGRVLVVGGMHWAETVGCSLCPPWQLSALSSAELYDPAKGQFTLTGSMSVRRVFHTATVLEDGKVLVAGGDDRYSATYASAEVYDPATGLFTLTAGPMITPRSGHTATRLANGKVLITGGDNGGATAAAELYDPATQEFTLTGSMITPRFFHTATLLNDGRVLITGGDTNGGVTSAAELYDPTTGTFSATGSMSVPRTAHAAALLASGQVLVVGGASTNGDTAAADVFDPASGAFTSVGNMTSPRQSHTATTLPDGKVLIAGGINATVALSSAELFDPAAGVFTPVQPMESERAEHCAILLNTGAVLIAGGINFNNVAGRNSLATAELFP